MCKVLVKTLGLSHEDWLRYRKLGLGGSDAGSVCSLSPYSSPMTVYYDKTGDEYNVVDNEAMKQGRDLEDYVAKRFMAATGLKVRRANSMFMHDQYPYLLANVDRMLVGENIGLECKTASPYSSSKWKDGQIPLHYLTQYYHYMEATGADTWYIAVVILGQEFKYARIERDEDIIQNLIKIETDFWNDHIIPRIIPEPDGSEAADKIINQYFTQANAEIKIELQGFDESLERRKEIDDLIDKLDVEKKKIEQELKMYMQDAEIAINDKFKVTWKNAITARLDGSRLKVEMPELYNHFCKSTNSRRLTIRTI